MGRGKMKMELIQNEKKREKTFQKRKKGLIKKAHEFTTLTGVNMGIIIYGPKTGPTVHPSGPEIWPNDPAQVQRIIDEFKAKRSRGPKACLLPDYFLKRHKTYRDATNNLKKAHYASKFFKWHDGLNGLSISEIQGLIAKLDSISDTVNQKMAVLKSKNNQMNVPALNTLNPKYYSFDYSMEQQQQQNHSQQHQWWAPDISSVMMLPLNGTDFTGQFGGRASYTLFSGYEPSPMSMFESATSSADQPSMLPLPTSVYYHHHEPAMEPLKLDQYWLQPSTSMLSLNSQLHFTNYYQRENKRQKFFD